ncbi:sugar phosphate isomerase/epimerase family protein [Paenibacillus mucilaginosus]|uniref:Xylose isomerase domain protein TIM barrel n=1 Tax=Paenibacillus mucilaginosus (strain KNP414) TaxID=1036673 RepID=F8FQI4_PAEMK|nr:TIM barrel protein [Paenibacillus mucilaginosus]AEI40339.1 Xylose isomerase domain protein TIM barrel [Paenibacillus mucilaginosus KNP414]MCG7213302.1 TIM barrel protein [Paenibacillus mucilaginosus]WDM29541.1 TIM barrel protein [Paenibacillus mucilaginosus]
MLNQPLSRVNDGSKKPPRLDLQQSWWAMIGLGNGDREWSLEEKFENIAKAGFTGILGSLPQPEESERWHQLLEEYGFSFGIHSFPAKRDDLASLLREAKSFGVQYVNSQVMNSFKIGSQAIDLLNELVEEAAAAGIPYFVETHRGRITQDLHRTVDYVHAIPELRLTIDLSHYVLAGEMVDESEQAEPFFDILLNRTSALHARVSNGQQIQVDIGQDAAHPMTTRFMRWWEKGIRSWLQEAQPGDVLPFVAELGPPSYAITMDNYGSEISNRWEQALVLKSLMEEAWHRALRNN